MTEIPPSVDPPFWSDDFDMDLPKIIPEAKSLLGEHAGLQLMTTGSVTDGRLNHPTCWNSHLGSIAMFRIRSGNWCRPAHYVSSDPTVVCTLWEAVRDAWAHSLVMLLDGELVFNGERLWPRHFQRLMWHVRGWGDPLTPAQVLGHKRIVIAQLRICARRVTKLVRQ